MWRILAERVQGASDGHSSASRWMPSTLGMDRRVERGGWEGDCPARKWVADEVRMRRIERLGWVEREERMRGILMVATEPEAARRRCFLPSEREAETVSAGVGGVTLGVCSFSSSLVSGGGGVVVVAMSGFTILLAERRAPPTPQFYLAIESFLCMLYTLSRISMDETHLYTYAGTTSQLLLVNWLMPVLPYTA